MSSTGELIHNDASRQEVWKDQQIHAKSSTDASHEYTEDRQAALDLEADGLPTGKKNAEEFDKARREAWHEDETRQENAADNYGRLTDDKDNQGLSYGSRLNTDILKRLGDWQKKWRYTPDKKSTDPYVIYLQNLADQNTAQKPFAMAVLRALQALNSGMKDSDNKDDQISPSCAVEMYLNPENQVFSNMQGNLLRILRIGLNRAEAAMDECLLYPESDTREFRQFYSEFKDIQLLVNNLTYGMLQVPADDAETLDEKKIHRIRNVKTIRPDGTEEMVDPPLPALTENGMELRYDSVQEHIQDPLFSHIPRPEDITQGRLQDCYMLASLAAVAAQDPMKIMEAMHDNEDGTVTVRFYDDNSEPVFVTVNKTIPCLANSNYKSDAYAQNCLWVQLFEKAYALSGLNFLKQGHVEKAENGRYTGKYHDIEGGWPVNFLPRLLGNKSKDTIDHTRRIGVPTFAPLVGGGYKDSEIKFYREIEQAIRKGAAVTCGIDAVTLPLWTSHAGLFTGHAYTLLGMEKDPNTGEMYVRIRNPYADFSRGYDEHGNAVAIPKEQSIRPGESLLRLRDFESVFSEVVIADIDMSPLDKKQLLEADAWKQHYGKAALLACQTILDSDRLLLRMLPFNSPLFNDLRKAAITAQKKLSTGVPNLVEMKQALKDLTDAAKAYRNYRDTQQRSTKKENRQRAVNRYYAAEMLCQLDSFIRENEVREPALREDAVLSELHRHTLEDPGNPSPARTAMQENMQNRLAAEVLNLPLIPPGEDLDLMKVNAQKGIAQAAEVHNRKDFIRYSAGAYYYDAAGKKAEHLSYDAGRKLLDPEKSEPEIRKLEPRVEKIMKKASPEEYSDLLKGKNIGNIIQHVSERSIGRYPADKKGNEPEKLPQQNQ